MLLQRYASLRTGFKPTKRSKAVWMFVSIVVIVLSTIRMIITITRNTPFILKRP